jgi:hypothetical protein
MSAWSPKAEIAECDWHVRSGPRRDQRHCSNQS